MADPMPSTLPLHQRRVYSLHMGQRGIARLSRNHCVRHGVLVRTVNKLFRLYSRHRSLLHRECRRVLYTSESRLDRSLLSPSRLLILDSLRIFPTHCDPPYQNNLSLSRHHRGHGNTSAILHRASVLAIGIHDVLVIFNLLLGCFRPLFLSHHQYILFDGNPG